MRLCASARSPAISIFQARHERQCLEYRFPSCSASWAEVKTRSCPGYQDVAGLGPDGPGDRPGKRTLAGAIVADIGRWWDVEWGVSSRRLSVGNILNRGKPSGQTPPGAARARLGAPPLLGVVCGSVLGFPRRRPRFDPSPHGEAVPHCPAATVPPISKIDGTGSARASGADDTP
jgi:hypothetical protein